MANKKKNKTPNLPPGSAQPPTVSTQTSCEVTADELEL